MSILASLSGMGNLSQRREVLCPFDGAQWEREEIPGTMVKICSNSRQCRQLGITLNQEKDTERQTDRHRDREIQGETERGQRRDRQTGTDRESNLERGESKTDREERAAEALGERGSLSVFSRCMCLRGHNLDGWSRPEWRNARRVSRWGGVRHRRL